MSAREPVIIETQSQPDAAVIWLHGLGADGSDFVPVVDQLQLASERAIRFIFPHAPVRPITINQGYPMPGWYDIRGLSMLDKEDEAGIRESAALLAGLCEQQETAGIDAGRIVVAGFSQGGAIALHCGCRYPRPLAGIMVLSSYLPLPAFLQHEMHPEAIRTPIFMAHGIHDDVIDFHYAIQSRERLGNNNFRLSWHQYHMGHSVCMEEISDIRQWLMSIL